MKYVFIVVLSLFLLSGCSTKKRIERGAKTLPSWYTQLQKSDTRMLYSVGEGEDKEQAILHALTAMLSTLSVSIASEHRLESKVQEGEINSIQNTSKNTIISRVEKIKISNYQILHVEKFGFQKYIVKIKVNKSDLFSSLEKEIQEKIETFQRKYEESTAYHALKKLAIYKEARDGVQTLGSVLLVMGSLHPHFNNTLYKEQMFEIQERYERFRASLTFTIHTNTQGEHLRAIIAQGLGVEQYKVAPMQKENRHFDIYVKSEYTKAHSYGFDIARGVISLHIEDTETSILATRVHHLIGQSTQGYKVAKEDLAKKLKKKIQNEGIASVIGLAL